MFGLLGVFFLAYQADARRGAAFDVVLQAGALAVCEHVVCAVSEHEDALEDGDCVVDRADISEGAEILTFAAFFAAMFADHGKVVVAGEVDVGERFIIAQKDVEARLEFFDKVGFEQERFGLGFGVGEFHLPCGGHHLLKAIGQFVDIDIR